MIATNRRAMLSTSKMRGSKILCVKTLVENLHFCFNDLWSSDEHFFCFYASYYAEEVFQQSVEATPVRRVLKSSVSVMNLHPLLMTDDEDNCLSCKSVGARSFVFNIYTPAYDPALTRHASLSQDSKKEVGDFEEILSHPLCFNGLWERRPKIPSVFLKVLFEKCPSET